MNQARIWLAVKPSVGIPIFLGAVATTSLFVHYQLLNNTTWVKAYLEGGKKKVSLQVPAQTAPSTHALAVQQPGSTVWTVT